MKKSEYETAFDQYEFARGRCENVQERIRRLLAQFTGKPGNQEEQFEEADLAEMDELRRERDRAFDEFRGRERTVLIDSVRFGGNMTSGRGTGLSDARVTTVL